MRPPPPVAYPLRRSAPLAIALVAAGLLPLLQGLIWWHSQPPWSGQRALVYLVLACSLLWALWALLVWVRWPQGRLQWLSGRSDAEPSTVRGQWRWQDARTGEVRVLQGVDVALDAQRHVLLRLRPVAGPAIWAWASRSADPGRWTDFRRAWTAVAR